MTPEERTVAAMTQLMSIFDGFYGGPGDKPKMAHIIATAIREAVAEERDAIVVMAEKYESWCGLCPRGLPASIRARGT
jgi:hypothetical protein